MFLRIEESVQFYMELYNGLSGGVVNKEAVLQPEKVVLIYLSR